MYLTNHYFTDIDECAGGPCKHGGTCIDLIGGFRCECPLEWTGDVCQVDVNECNIMYPMVQQQQIQEQQQQHLRTFQRNQHRYSAPIATNSSASNFLANAGPCLNAVRCINLPGSFQCVCQEGWGGTTCSKNFDDCLGQCKNGATCIDLVNDYHCACASGFTGKLTH